MKQINILNRLSVSRDSGLSRPRIPKHASTDNAVFVSSSPDKLINITTEQRSNLVLSVDGYLDTLYNSNLESASVTDLNFVIDFKNFTGSDFKYLFDNSDGSAGFFIRHNNNILALTLFTSENTYSREVHILPTNTNQIAFQVRDSKLRYFVNRRFVSELDILGNLVNPNTTDKVGSEYTGGNGVALELLGVARSNVRLSDEEFLLFLDYDESLSYEYLLKCNEGTGSIITDYSINQSDAIAYNFSWTSNKNDAVQSGNTITFPKNYILNTYKVGSNMPLLDKAFFRNTDESEYGIYDKMRLYTCGYVTSSIHIYDERFNLLSSKNLYDEVNSQGQIEYSNTIGPRAICTNLDRSLFFVPTNKTDRRIYLFAKDLSWTGCYVDINNMSSSPESIYIGNNGNIFVSADTERNVYEYSFSLTTGWNVEVGQLENTYDLSVVVPSQITGIVQDRVTDNWYMISNTTDEIYILDATYTLIESVSISKRIGGLFTNFQALEKVGDVFFLSNVNYDAFIVLDANFNLLDWCYQSEDVSMIGIACASVGLEGTELEKTLNYFNNVEPEPKRTHPYLKVNIGCYSKDNPLSIVLPDNTNTYSLTDVSKNRIIYIEGQSESLPLVIKNNTKIETESNKDIFTTDIVEASEYRNIPEKLLVANNDTELREHLANSTIARKRIFCNYSISLSGSVPYNISGTNYIETTPYKTHYVANGGTITFNTSVGASLYIHTFSVGENTVIDCPDVGSIQLFFEYLKSVPNAAELRTLSFAQPSAKIEGYYNLKDNNLILNQSNFIQADRFFPWRKLEEDYLRKDGTNYEYPTLSKGADDWELPEDLQFVAQQNLQEYFNFEDAYYVTSSEVASGIFKVDNPITGRSLGGVTIVDGEVFRVIGSRSFYAEANAYNIGDVGQAGIVYKIAGNLYSEFAFEELPGLFSVGAQAFNAIDAYTTKQDIDIIGVGADNVLGKINSEKILNINAGILFKWDKTFEDGLYRSIGKITVTGLLDIRIKYKSIATDVEHTFDLIPREVTDGFVWIENLSDLITVLNSGMIYINWEIAPFNNFVYNYIYSGSYGSAVGEGHIWRDSKPDGSYYRTGDGAMPRLSTQRQTISFQQDSSNSADNERELHIQGRIFKATI